VGQAESQAESPAESPRHLETCAFRTGLDPLLRLGRYHSSTSDSFLAADRVGVRSEVAPEASATGAQLVGTTQVRFAGADRTVAGNSIAIARLMNSIRAVAAGHLSVR
jgi:hypothetical protein